MNIKAPARVHRALAGMAGDRDRDHYAGDGGAPSTLPLAPGRLPIRGRSLRCLRVAEGTSGCPYRTTIKGTVQDGLGSGLRAAQCTHPGYAAHWKSRWVKAGAVTRGLSIQPDTQPKWPDAATTVAFP